MVTELQFRNLQTGREFICGIENISQNYPSITRPNPSTNHTPDPKKNIENYLKHLKEIGQEVFQIVYKGKIKFGKMFDFSKCQFTNVGALINEDSFQLFFWYAEYVQGKGSDNFCSTIGGWLNNRYETYKYNEMQIISLQKYITLLQIAQDSCGEIHKNYMNLIERGVSLTQEWRGHKNVIEGLVNYTLEINRTISFWNYLNDVVFDFNQSLLPNWEQLESRFISHHHVEDCISKVIQQSERKVFPQDYFVTVKYSDLENTLDRPNEKLVSTESGKGLKNEIEWSSNYYSKTEIGKGFTSSPYKDVKKFREIATALLDKHPDMFKSNNSERPKYQIDLDKYKTWIIEKKERPILKVS